MSIFKLVGDIFVNNEKANENIDETEKKGQGLGKTFLKGAKVVGAFGLAFAGAATATAVAGINMSTDIKKSVNSISAATGATDEELKEMEESMKNIFKNNFGESFEDIADTITKVKQTTQLTGEELEKTAQNALLMRDSFDFDVEGSINTVNTLMKQFGITSERAYELIAIGAQNGANKNGDLLDVMNEYAPQFEALGFGADVFVETLVDGAESGAFEIDKIGDAVKEFNIRSKDMSDSSADAFQSLGLDASEMFESFAAGGDSAGMAFQEVTELLADVEDPLEKNRIGVALFGSQFEDLEAGVVDVFANLDGAIGGNNELIREMSGTLDDINAVKYDTFSEAFEGIKRTIMVNGVAPIGEKLVPILTDVVNWINSNMPLIEETFDKVFTAVGATINFIVGIITTYLIPTFMIIKDWVVDNMPLIKQGFEDTFNFIMEVVNIFIELFQTIWNEFGEEIMAGLEFFWEFFKQSFQIGFEIIKGIFDFWIAIFKGDWKAAWEKFKEIISLVWKQIETSLKLALDILKSIIDIGLTAIETVVTNIFNNIKDFISGIWDGIVNGVKESINFIIDLINGMITKINDISIDVPFSDEEIGFSVPTIPRLQVGGTITSAGRVMVGEAGPEELLLPAGASVIPLNKQGMSGGIQVIVQGNTLLGDDDEMADKLGTIVVDRLRELGVVTA